jgi:RNA polymerase sigma factor (sigma-70 family)
MEQTDRDLVLACRRGDETAWEALVGRYQRLIYTIPRRAGLDEDLSSDVFQEVFATLFEKLDGLEQPEKLKAWLVTTAKRKTWRLISREGRPSKFEDTDDEGDIEFDKLPDNAPLPDEVLVQLEEQHRVRSAVASLNERCRKLLTLLFYQQEPPPYSEIAAQIGTTEGSIGPTRARCLQKLLRLLEK